MEAHAQCLGQETHGIQNDVLTNFQRKMIMNDEIMTQNLVVRPRLNQPLPLIKYLLKSYGTNVEK